MTRRHNSNGGAGQVVRQDDEMRAFDALPAALRRELNTSAIKWLAVTAVPVLLQHPLDGAAYLIRVIRQDNAAHGRPGIHRDYDTVRPRVPTPRARARVRSCARVLRAGATAADGTY